MTQSILLGLLQNTAILLAFSMLYDNLWIKHNRDPKPLNKILIGLLIGAIGIILMLTPWTLVPGLVFDTRSVMLSISGLFFGFLPTVVAMIIDILYRAYLGGAGVWMGIITIISAGSIGILWRYYRLEKISKNKNIEFLMLGVSVHIMIVLGAFTMPFPLAIQTIKTIALPIVVVYIPATVLLGRLMCNQYENWLIKRQMEQLLESEQKLNHDLVIAKEKAEESDRLKTAFLANLSHEIRTPLNGILGFADILKTSSFSAEEVQEYTSLIRVSGVRMLEIMQNLIDISKLESGNMQMHYSNLNINEQLDNLYYLFIDEVTDKGLVLHHKKSLPDSDALLWCDEDKVNSTLSNLLKNAIKFSTKGKIEFGYIRNEEGLIEFFVSDEGIGIPHEQKEFIFQRFTQGDSEYYFREGTGLGLTVAKAFVELMGGEIWINSIPGSGTEVRFTIPSKTTSEKIILTD